MVWFAVFVMDVPNATWGSLRQVYQGICTNTHQNTALEMYETSRKLWFKLNQAQLQPIEEIEYLQMSGNIFRVTSITSTIILTQGH
jgi:hypothetical protein